jgi:hypothetical protein
LQPIPLGIPGELCIAGVGLAREYLNRPDLTRQRFISDPFDQSENGGRLYRTGDLARYLADGTLEYIGRIDDQVKLRGYRIELGEIEVALSEHPDVRDAVVLAQQGDAGHQRLVAYVTPRISIDTLVHDELRQFLRMQLPDYMIPNSFVLLEEMPLTANKKIDRRALLALEHRNATPTFIEPRDDLEHVLADILAKVMKIDRIGANSNFLELGGNSLLATRIVVLVRETLRADITIPQFFNAAEVSALAGVVRSALPRGQADRIAAAVRRLQRMSQEEKDELRKRRAKGDLA